MARVAGEIFTARPVASAGRRVAQADAAARTERAPTRDRSDGSMEQNRWRFYCGAFCAGRFARRHSVRARAPAGVALRARASVEDRHLAEVETTLRRQSDSRCSLPRWLIAELIQ